MKVLELSEKDKLEFQMLLPHQGSLEILEMVERIKEKIKVDKIKDDEKLYHVKFEDDELSFVVEMIHFLDKNLKLNFSSLSLIRKILEITKETK
jgi:hypothetical protein